MSGESMRVSLEKIIEKDSQPIVQDPYSLFKIALESAGLRWKLAVCDQEGYLLPGVKPQYIGATDARLSEKESFGEYLKQTLSMLETDIQIIDTLNAKFVSFTSEGRHLAADYQFFSDKVASQIQHNTDSIPIITAMIAVDESRKAIKQANDVKALTVLATLYIPLSYVASIFGMNVTQFSPEVEIWGYFVVALPITAVSLLLVWKWESICRGFMRAFKPPDEDSFEEMQMHVYNLRPPPTLGVFGKMGNMVAGPGLPPLRAGIAGY
ncbi:hypothetical protein LSUE1_G007176 [Lachnellula suecica]|uniref:Uncharacterized protein n=1 Tax=Lachnellula suecica TaxID=602035 RepID=A0A8T9BXC7_9HELO|nr:hypothetical protein LSUE1_G007176 [Lachnellula suecica]